jgi:hypothetical protein
MGIFTSMESIPKLTEIDLKPWFDKPKLILDCAAQTQKDLAQYGIEFSFSGNVETIYEELFSQIQPQIEALLKKGISLMEILYRVDVDEAKVKTISRDNELLSASITRLILWRELQKVVTRFLLSQ